MINDASSVRKERESRAFAEFVGCRPVDEEFMPVDDMAVEEVPVEETGKQNCPPVPGGHMQWMGNVLL